MLQLQQRVGMTASLLVDMANPTEYAVLSQHSGRWTVEACHTSQQLSRGIQRGSLGPQGLPGRVQLPPSHLKVERTNNPADRHSSSSQDSQVSIQGCSKLPLSQDRILQKLCRRLWWQMCLWGQACMALPLVQVPQQSVGQGCMDMMRCRQHRKCLLCKGWMVLPHMQGCMRLPLWQGSRRLSLTLCRLS